MRYKVKLWEDADGFWTASLYEDPVNRPLNWTGELVTEKTREDALREIRAKRDYIESDKGEAEWLTLDDVPEPQSLRV